MNKSICYCTIQGAKVSKGLVHPLSILMKTFCKCEYYFRQGVELDHVDIRNKIHYRIMWMILAIKGFLRLAISITNFDHWSNFKPLKLLPYPILADRKFCIETWSVPDLKIKKLKDLNPKQKSHCICLNFYFFTLKLVFWKRAILTMGFLSACFYNKFVFYWILFLYRHLIR
jgi:hypothetical protein